MTRSENETLNEREKNILTFSTRSASSFGVGSSDLATASGEGMQESGRTSQR